MAFLIHKLEVITSRINKVEYKLHYTLDWRTLEEIRPILQEEVCSECSTWNPKGGEEFSTEEEMKTCWENIGELR